MKRILLLILTVICIDSYAQKIVGYFPSYRSASVNTVQYNKLTDLMFAFINPINGGNGTLERANAWDATFGFDMTTFVAVKAKCDATVPRTKLHISVGGADNADARANNLATISADNTKRAVLIADLIDFADDYDLDGIDIDWEFPKTTAAKNAHELLLRDLRTAINTYNSTHASRPLRLGVAVGGEYAGSVHSIQYFNTNAFQYVDDFHLMTYDMPEPSGQPYSATSHSSYDDALGSINGWATAGVPKSKMVLGVPFYGKLDNSRANTINYNAIPNASFPAAFTSDVYNNYYYNGKTTLDSKVDLIQSQGGQGIMIWDLGQDRTDQYSLLSAIYTKMQSACLAPQPNLGADALACSPATVTLNANVTVDGTRSFTWKRNGTIVSGPSTSAGANQYQPTQSGLYTVEVKVGSCTKTDDNNVTISTPLTVTGGTRCGAGTVPLSVTGSGTYNWYDVSTGGSSLASGNSYSPNVTATKTFYVADVSSSTNYNTGKAAIDASNFAVAIGENTHKIVVSQDLKILDLRVYVNTGYSISNARVNVVSGADRVTVLQQSSPQNLAAGPNTIITNLSLQPGTYYLKLSGTVTGGAGPLLHEANWGATGTLPDYVVPGVITISQNNHVDFGAGADASPNIARFNTFFNFNISVGTPSACGRTAVVATVNSGANVAVAATAVTPICTGVNGTINIATSESGISYQAFKGATSVSTSVNGTGGAISLTIPSANLTAGNNTIIIKATKAGCGTSDLTTQPIIVVNTASAPTITYNDITKTYGDAAFSHVATSTSAGTLTYSLVSSTPTGIVTVSPAGLVTITGAGTASVRVDQAANGCNSAGSKTITLTVGKKALTATAEAKTKVYNTANPALTISYAGFVGSDNASGIDVAPTASTIATTTSDAGTYTITLTGGSDNNYNITTVNGTLTVTKANRTVTITSSSTGTVGSVIALAYTTTGGGTASWTNSNGAVATLSGANLTLTGAGTTTVEVTVAADLNYNAATANMVITVSAAPAPTITYNDITKTYGDAAFSHVATSNSAGALTYSLVSSTPTGIVTVSPAGLVTITGAGTASIRVDQAANGSFGAGSKTITLTVGKKVLTATADAKTKVYNTANPALTISYTGFVGSDNASGIDVAPTISTTAITTSNAGTYPITLTGGSDNNYTITTVNGTLTVTKANRTVTITSGSTGTVGSVIALAYTTTGGGTASWTNSNGAVATLSGANLTLTGAGTTTVEVTVAADLNYNAATANMVITVGAAPTPTITYGDITKTYGDAAFSHVATSNSAGALTYSLVSSTPTGIVTVSPAGLVTITGAGTASIRVDQAANGSFGAGSKTITLTVGKKALTATAEAKTKVYNTANPALTIAYTGFVGTDNAAVIDVAPTASTTAITTSPVNTYPITLTGGSDNNYDITLVPGVLTVTKANRTVAITSTTTGTVGSVIALTYTSTGGGTAVWSHANQSGTAVLSGSNLTLSAAGTVSVTATIPADVNYNEATLTIQITIGTAPTPTITYGDITKTYGDAAFSHVATSNSAGALTYSLVSSTPTGIVTVSPAGLVTITGAGTASIRVDQAANGSFGVGTKTITLTVGKKVLTATAEAKTKVYNTANPALTIAYTGFVGTDNAAVIDVAPTASTTAITTSPVNTYPITLTGGSDNNYEITRVNGVLTVTKANRTVAITSATTGTVGSVIALTYTSTGGGTAVWSHANQSGTAVLSGSNLTLSTAGTVSVTATIPADVNYNEATLTIQITIGTAPSPTITYGDITKTYGDAAFSHVATSNSAGALTYSLVSSTPTGIVTVSPAGLVTITGAGTASIRVDQAANGSFGAGSKTITLTVGKKVLTATADAKTKVYNTANPALTISYAGFVGSDNASGIDVAPTISTTAITTSDAGTYTITLTGGSDNNYTITTVNGTLTVTKANRTVTITSASTGVAGTMIFLAHTTIGGGAVTWTRTNESGTASLVGSNLTLQTAGTVRVYVTVAADANYNEGTANMQITISSSPAPTIVYSDITKTYGDAAFVHTATSNSAGAITYSLESSIPTGIVTVAANGLITISGAGTATVKATQAANGSFGAGSKLITVTVNKADRTVSITAPSSGAAGGTIGLTSSMMGGGVVTWSVTNQSGSATVSGTNLTLVSAGTVKVQVSVAADANYNAATNSMLITISGTPAPTISFDDITKSVGSAAFMHTATSNSAGAITYSLVTSTPAGVITVASNGMITVLGPGTAIVKADQVAHGLFGAGSKMITVTINSTTGLFGSQSAGISLKSYPNPFETSSSIEFELVTGGEVSLSVYDVLGYNVLNLLEGESLGAGTHTIPLSGISPGVYMVKVKIGDKESTIKVIKN